MNIPIQLNAGGRVFQCDPPIALEFKKKHKKKIFRQGSEAQLVDFLREKPGSTLVAHSEGEITAYFLPEENTDEAPSFLKKAVSFAKANIEEVRAIMHGESSVSDDTISRRLEICRRCDDYDEDGETCRRCGCFTKWKTAYRSERCPAGKW